MKIKDGILENDREYSPGDWVVLGPYGSGWGPDDMGRIVQIADIGDHLKGKLLYPSYDFYVTGRSYRISGQLSNSRMGGGSWNIKRLATDEDIRRLLTPF